jgi:hypothetical protein
MADSIVHREEKNLDTEKNAKENTIIVTSTEASTERRVRVNASGHVDQLDRQYGLLSICATALTIGESCLVSRSASSTLTPIDKTVLGWP